MNIHESAEDYLEKILMLQEQKGSVRSIDIAVAMGFSKPSVSVAMKNLRENGYISMDPDGFIKLEQPGMEIAQRIYGRHRKLTAFFVALGVDPDVAAKDACKVEHDLSEETYSKMIAFAEIHRRGGFHIRPWGFTAAGTLLGGAGAPRPTPTIPLAISTYTPKGANLGFAPLRILQNQYSGLLSGSCAGSVGSAAGAAAG